MVHNGDNVNIDELVTFGKDLVRRVGARALKWYGKGDPRLKFDEELVTEAELALVDFFRDELRTAFPEHALFGDALPKKDYVHGGTAYLWIFDPLDGVANFQAGIPIWGTSVALLENFWPIFGVFFMPVTGDLLHARVGGQAFWNDEPVQVPESEGINNESLLLTYSRFHSRYRSLFPGKIRNLGCTAAHISYVARGRAEAALLANLSYRDLAAAQIILEAAGGKIYTLEGKTFHPSDYLDGRRIEEHLLAVPVGAHTAIRMYLEEHR